MPDPTPVPSPKSDSGIGRKKQTVADKLIDALLGNISLVAKYGITTVFACALLAIVSNEYTKDREAARQENADRFLMVKENQSLNKSMNESNREAISKMSIALDRVSESTVLAAEAARDAKEGVIKQLDALKAISAGLSVASDERKHFWEPMLTETKGMRTDLKANAECDRAQTEGIKKILDTLAPKKPPAPKAPPKPAGT